MSSTRCTTRRRSSSRPRPRSILEDVERLKPTRVVFDSLSELRLVAGNPLRYRRQILALKQFFAGRNCTVILLDDMTATDHDLHVQSIAHGVIMLQHLSPEYGAERRRLRVIKYRGRQFRGGFHDYLIRRGGLLVFPRLIAAEHRGRVAAAKLASSVKELDDLLGGGIEEGTSTLIVGGAGTGKSTIAAQFCVAAAHARREVDHLHVRRESRTRCSRAAPAWASTSKAQVRAGRSRSCRSIRRSCRRASSRT